MLERILRSFGVEPASLQPDFTQGNFPYNVFEAGVDPNTIRLNGDGVDLRHWHGLVLTAIAKSEGNDKAVGAYRIIARNIEAALQNLSVSKNHETTQ